MSKRRRFRFKKRFCVSITPEMNKHVSAVRNGVITRSTFNWIVSDNADSFDDSEIYNHARDRKIMWYEKEGK